jgi:Family of unknown function (DUF6516)
MPAQLLIDDRIDLAANMFVELVVWQVPKPVRGSRHSFKYRLALIIDGKSVLRYDNEAGKGDHRHIGRQERAYRFTDLDALQEDFWRDVEAISERAKR